MARPPAAGPPGPGPSADGPGWRERLAHALTPWEWRGRNLAALLVVFALVAATTVVQRALLAAGPTGWAWVVVHGVLAVVVVVALGRRAVRNWRAVQAGAGPDQPSAGVPS